MKVKLCGFKDRQSVLSAITNGADFIGFVFCEKSARYIDPDKVAEIAKIIPPSIAKVAVLANTDLKVIKKKIFIKCEQFRIFRKFYFVEFPN